eukprot:s683_g10.t1
MDLCLETDLMRAIDGAPVNVMAETAYRIPGATVCSSTIHHVSFFTTLELDSTKGTVVMLNFQKRTVAGKIWVEPTNESIWFQRQNPNIQGNLTMIEACAGIGAMGQGFHTCGISTACYNDYNPKFCQWLRNKTEVPVVEGNMTHPQTIHAVHLPAPDSHILTGGVACQPFSVLGDQKEQYDQRSESFPGLLTMGFFLKCFLIVMECTKEARQSAWAQSILNQFCLQTGYVCQQTILHLHHLWPSVRTRWWAVLHHPSIHVQSIPQMPKMPFEPSIIHLIPAMLQLPPDQLEQLILTIHKLAMFKSQPRGLAGSVVDMFKAIPTATHSWGNQLSECACGCRPEGFSMSRLLSRGLYGQLIPVGAKVNTKDFDFHSMRHMHPQEVALLCGLKPSYVAPDASVPLKLALAGVGQLASPIQAVWVCSNFLYQMGIQGILPLQPPPTQCLKNLLQGLLTDRNAWLNCSHPNMSMKLFAQGLDRMFGPEQSSDSEDTFTQSVLRTLTEAESLAPSLRYATEVVQSPSTATAFDTSEVRTVEHPFPLPPVLSEADRQSVDDAADAMPSHVFFQAKPSLPSKMCPSRPPDHEEVGLVGTGSVHEDPEAETPFLAPPFACGTTRDTALICPVSPIARLPASKPHQVEDSGVGLHVDAPSHVAFQAMPVLPTDQGPTHDPKIQCVPHETDAQAFNTPSRPELTVMPTAEDVHSIDATELSTSPTPRVDSSHPAPSHVIFQAMQSPSREICPTRTLSIATTPQIEIPLQSGQTFDLALPHVSQDTHEQQKHHHMISAVYHHHGGINCFAAQPVSVKSGPQTAGTDPIIEPSATSQVETTAEISMTLSTTPASDSRLLAPSHVPFQAMPDLARDSGPALAFSSATNESEERPTKKHKGDRADMSDPVDDEHVNVSTSLALPTVACITVRIGLLGSIPHEVLVSQNSTVGQLVVTEGRLLGLDHAWQAMDMVGRPLDLTQTLGKYDIVFMFPADQAIPAFDADLSARPMGCRTVHERLELLWYQRGWVATDEMNFYLQQLHAWGHHTTAPIIATNVTDLNERIETWFIQAMELAYQQPGPSIARTAFLIHGHWQPLKVRVTREQIDIYCTQEGYNLLTTLPDIISFDDAMWNLIDVDPVFPCDCGFQAFAWLHEVDTGGVVTPMSVIRAAAMRTEFENACLLEYHRSPIDFGGVIEDQILRQLHLLLESHGVDPDRTTTCANHLVTVLGRQNIANSLAAPKPWQDLKAKASSQRPPIQIVLTEELHKAVARRAQAGRPVGRKATKKQAQTNKKSLILQADKISIPNGIFQQQDGSMLAQLSIRQISGDAKGIVVTNVSDALPFFQLNEPMSAQGIALLILDHQDPRIPDSKTIVQFPAHFSDTDEPILVTAAMLQIGAQQVKRFRPDTCVQVEEVATRVVRLLAYRDQLKLEWASLLEGPVKALLAMDTLTQIAADHILDIWDRQYLDSQVRKVPSKDAFMFAVTLRLQTAAATTLLTLSGKDGLFTEPRTDTGRLPDPTYRVVWLPKKSYAEAAFINQTTTQQSWLVRNGTRYGIRVHETDASDVHHIHRPEVSFLEGTTVMTYKVVVASARTLRHMNAQPSRTFDKTGTDPWLQQDPWQSPAKPVPPALTSAQLASMQHTIEQNIRSSIQVPEDAAMSTAQDTRVSALEDQVKQLTTSVTQLTGNFNTLNTQQHQLGGQVQKLKTHMDSQHASLHSLIDSKMEDQMSRIEALLSKRRDLLKGEHAIWGVSETHLTTLGAQKFKGELAFNRSHYAYHPGAPVPLLSHTFRYCDQWIHGAVFYGPAQRAETTATRQEADSLLSHLTQQIVLGLPGKRFITGDFNQLPNVLPQTAIWAAHGWKEVQDMQQQQHGTVPLPTCKASTRKDFLWISPELQPFWLSTAVDQLLFKDHAVLSATFAPFGKPAQKQPMPTGTFKFCPERADSFCTSLADEFEHRAIQMSLAITGQALQPCQRGRSHTSEVVLVPESMSLLRPSRPGSAAPQFHGTHMTHKRWFKQLRRLEAFARNAQKPACTASKTIHLTREWRAILKAPGFPGGFATWWACRPKHMPEVPYNLPESPLDAQAATTLCFAFEVEVRSLEQVLIKELKNKAKQAHEDNPQKIFRDVQKPQVQPVQMLTDRSQAVVREVLPEENAFIFDAPVTFDPSKPLTSSKGPLLPVVVTEDKVWVEALHSLEPGDVVKQESHVGDLATLFARFGHEWSACWDKHAHEPESIWDPILEFIDQHIPAGPQMPYEPITAEQILRSVKSKKRTAATGPDGWSRADILAMAPDLVQSVADMFTWIESGLPLTGCMLDLIKAFNHLPRLPLMKVGAMMGLPIPILRSWATALHAMERRFHVRGATGPPLRSTSGLPEGCGLSVVGMLLTNVIANRWLEVRVPRCALWSYVDNIEISAATAFEVQQGYQELDHILKLLDVPIDPQKTVFWSTQPEERKELRNGEFPVVY